jgi:hypothetical protein
MTDQPDTQPVKEDPENLASVDRGQDESDTDSERGSGVGEFHHKSLVMINTVNEILEGYRGPMTLRQVYYRLVATQVITNDERAYKALSATLTKARRAGLVDPARIIDRLRHPTRVSCWEDLSDFLQTVRRSYRREKWTTQPRDVEVWVEKDALAGVLQPLTNEYEVTLFACRGYNSYSALHEAAERLSEDTTILYLGDFDPSGADMSRDIRERLEDDFGVSVELRVLALTHEQVETYSLPPAPAKRKDPRAAAFVAKHGDMAVELDALPPDVLLQLVREGIEEYLVMSIFEEEREREAEERAKLDRLIVDIE